MFTKIEQISRQDADFLKHVYKIRQLFFEEELGFSREDRMVYNEWDALSTHYLLIHNGKPSGTISVVDWTGLSEILNSQNIPTNLKIAKMTKLAILPEARGILNLRKLIYTVVAELENFEYLTADVAPPSSNPGDTSRYKLGVTYQNLFSLERIATFDDCGVVRHIFGRKL